MANEWVLVNELYPVSLLYVTCNNNDAIAKGTLMCIGEDPREGTIHTGITQTAIGVTQEEKVAGDGQTRIGVRPFAGAVWDVVADGSIALGDPVACGDTANMVRAPRTGDLSHEELKRLLAGGKSTCLETATDAERVQILFP